MRITRYVNGKRKEGLPDAVITVENDIISDTIDAVNRRIAKGNTEAEYNRRNGGGRYE